MSHGMSNATSTFVSSAVALHSTRPPIKPIGTPTRSAAIAANATLPVDHPGGLTGAVASARMTARSRRRLVR